MKAYIQYQNMDWLNENCYAAQYGFNRMGYHITTFSVSDTNSLILSQDDIVFGGINTMHHIMQINGITIPEVPDITKVLKNFYERKLFTATIGDIRNEKFNYPFFVKPLSSYKLFTGFVCKSIFDIKTKIPVSVLDTIPILISEIVSFESEYRCFVLDRKLIGCKNYTGNFKVLPDFNKIESAISEYKNSASAYTIDFGILSDGSTELIEINDAYGFGSYGLNPILFCKMIEKRWKEIFKDKN